MEVKKTNLDMVKNVFRSFLYLPIEKTSFYPLIVNHPVFECGVTMVRGENDEYKQLNLCENEDDLNMAINSQIKAIETIDNLDEILMFVRKPYKLCFLKYCKPYISKNDFSKVLGNVWVMIENGNQDINVSVGTIANWFKTANKQFLMDDEERKFIDNLPEEFDIYRGVGEGRNPKGLSWTIDMDVARWFANRWNKTGYIIRGRAKKNDILAYFGNRVGSGESGETEIVIQHSKVMNKEKIQS